MKALIALIWLTACGLSAAQDPVRDKYQATLDKEVKYMRDLQADLALSKAKKKPLLIFYTQVNCSFCHNVRNQHLKHIALNTNAPVIIREVMSGIDHFVAIGKNSETADAFYRRMGIRFFPTVVLYDSNLKPVADPLMGSDTSGFYGAYLDNAIEAAVAAVK